MIGAVKSTISELRPSSLFLPAEMSPKMKNTRTSFMIKDILEESGKNTRYNSDTDRESMESGKTQESDTESTHLTTQDHHEFGKCQNKEMSISPPSERKFPISEQRLSDQDSPTHAPFLLKPNFINPLSYPTMGLVSPDASDHIVPDFNARMEREYDRLLKAYKLSMFPSLVYNEAMLKSRDSLVDCLSYGQGCKATTLQAMLKEQAYLQQSRNEAKQAISDSHFRERAFNLLTQAQIERTRKPIEQSHYNGHDVNSMNSFDNNFSSQKPFINSSRLRDNGSMETYESSSSVSPTSVNEISSIQLPAYLRSRFGGTEIISADGKSKKCRRSRTVFTELQVTIIDDI